MKTIILSLLLLGTSVIAEDRPPEMELQQPGVRLELVAEHPDLATPTGVDVDGDGDGRIWVVACHTHMPPEEHQGPDYDEILVFDPEGGRGVFQRV